MSAFPTSNLIEAAAEAGIRPIICRQERVGVGIADGYSRVNNGKPPGVFAMQFGPGAENAYAGVATAFSDAVPMLLLPLGHSREREGVFPQFSSLRNYAPVTKFVEQVTTADRVVDTMRRAFARLKMGRPGPVMVEIPADVAGEQLSPSTVESYRPVKAAVAAADPADIMAAAKALLDAREPRDPCRARGAVRRGGARAAGAGGAHRRPGGNHHGRQERVPPKSTHWRWEAPRAS